MDHEPVLIDEVVLHQRVDQLATAEHQQVLTVLLLEPGNCFCDMVLDQAGIPRHLREGRGNHVLGQAVHALAILSGILHGWPGFGKALIGHSPQQKPVGSPEFIEFTMTFLMLFSFFLPSKR